MNIYCIIPARGGSKGVPRKNILPFMDKPLIQHSIEYAQSSEWVNGIFVSTDDQEISSISEHAGATVIQRPVELAGDAATTESAIEHAISWWDERNLTPDIIVLLQATSPLRPDHSLGKALKQFMDGKFDSMLSISPTHRFFWKIKGGHAQAEYDYLNRPRRQDMTKEDIRYVENGSVYIFSHASFLKTKNRLGGSIGYTIFPEDYSLEIDTEMDFKLLENVANKLVQ